MGDVIISLGGGGGADLDVVTASAGDVLDGKVFVGTDGEPIIGTKPNNGAMNASLSCGQSKSIPAGHTDGGTVTANSLASQTGGASADDTKVLSGYTYWKDGIKRTGNLAVQSVINFSVAQYSNLTLICTWANPSRGPWSGLRIICKQGSYPSNPWDGTFFYEGSSTYCTNSLPEGTWYFRAWNYINTSAGVIYGGWNDASVWNGRVQGQQIFTTSGIFIVPAAVRSVEIFCVGGGSSGARSMYYDPSNSLNTSNYCAGGGGGSGYTATAKNINISPGEQLSIVIGSGGSNNITSASNPGFATYVLKSGINICNANGGEAGEDSAPSSGGSGGGTGGNRSGITLQGKAGGSDGSDGKDSGTIASPRRGKGQGATTRAFAESSNTLYAGGGGGATKSSSLPCGDGGAGGGGKGGDFGNLNGIDGSANTGGGGGGSCQSDTHGVPGAGGSGICIIRWGY